MSFSGILTETWPTVVHKGGWWMEWTRRARMNHLISFGLDAKITFLNCLSNKDFAPRAAPNDRDCIQMILNLATPLGPVSNLGETLRMAITTFPSA